MADTAWTLGWSVFSFVLGAVVSHKASLYREKRKEFNEAARPFLDWIAVHLSRAEDYDAPPGVAARAALAAKLSKRKRLLFHQLINIVEREYRFKTHVSFTGRIVKERTDRARDCLARLQELLKPR